MVKKDLNSDQAKVAGPDKKVNSKTQDSSALNFNNTALIGGMALIIAGLFFLARSLNLISFGFGQLFNLWPLLLIMIGLGIIGDINKGWRKLTILLQIAILMLGAVMLLYGYDHIGSGYMWRQNRQEEVYVQQLVPRDLTATSAKLKVEAAGDLTITSQAQDSLMDVKGSSSTAFSTSQGGIQTINLDFESLMARRGGAFIDLNQITPFDISLELGAGQLRADLREVKVKQLKINSGASDIRVDVGRPIDEQPLKIKIEVGMSNVELSLPTGFGVNLTSDSGLSDVDTTGLTKISDGVFQSLDYANATVKYDIYLKSGFASFKINYY